MCFLWLFFCQLVMISGVHNTHWIHNKHAPVCTVTVICVCYSFIIENTTSVTPYLRALYDNWLGWTVSESHSSPSINTSMYWYPKKLQECKTTLVLDLSLFRLAFCLGPFHDLVVPEIILCLQIQKWPRVDIELPRQQKPHLWVNFINQELSS